MRAALRYRSAPARRAEILELLRASAYLSQAELSRQLGVSEMTVRRDARGLEARGLLKVVPGGILRVVEPAPSNDYQLRVDRHIDAKRAIAEAAAALIATDSTIALDAGTTVLEVARLLVAPRPGAVVTPSLPVMCLLGDRPGIELVGLGGVLRTRTQAFAGPATIEALRHLRVAQLFLAARAVGAGGTYEGNTWDSEIKRAMIEAADEVILLADSTKFALRAMAHVAPLSALTAAVVDDATSMSDVEMLDAAGVRVIKASPLARNGMPGFKSLLEQPT